MEGDSTVAMKSASIPDHHLRSTKLRLDTNHETAEFGLATRPTANSPPSDDWRQEQPSPPYRQVPVSLRHIGWFGSQPSRPDATTTVEATGFELISLLISLHWSADITVLVRVNVTNVA
jgi:hypothetical protein